jgi:hypothetical protein
VSFSRSGGLLILVSPFFGTGSDFGPVVDQIRRIGLSLVRSTGVHRIDLAGAPPIWVVVSAVSR